MGCANASAVADRYQEECAIVEDGLEPGKHDREDFNKYFILKGILGKGSFAQVHSAVEVTSGKEVAVKVLDLQQSTDAERQRPGDRKLRRANKEVMVMLRLTQHPHCVRCYNSFSDDRFMYIVMEACQSTLLEALKGLTDVTESTYAGNFRQVFLALEYIHSRNVVHRDVKPDNFLCHATRSSGLRLKLGDFGLAEVLPSWSGPFPLKACQGTAPYMSPEMVRFEGYGVGTDVWSAGVTAYVLMLGGFPYKPIGPKSEDMKSAIAEAALEPSFMPCPGVDSSGKMRISKVGEDFLREVLVRDRKARPSAAKVLASRWLHSWAPDGPEPSLRQALHGAQRAGAFDLRTRAGSKESRTLAPLPKASPHSRVSRRLAPSKPQLLQCVKQSSIDDAASGKTESTELPQAFLFSSGTASTSSSHAREIN